MDDATVNTDSELWEAFEKQFKQPKKYNLILGVASALSVVVSFLTLPRPFLSTLVPSLFFLAAVYFIVKVLETSAVSPRGFLRYWPRRSL